MPGAGAGRKEERMSLIVTCYPENGHKDKCPFFRMSDKDDVFDIARELVKQWKTKTSDN